MTQMLLKAHRLEIGALYRKDVMARLDELGLPYREHRSFLDSTIIVKTYNEAHLTALRTFKREFKAWQARLQAAEDKYDREQIARKNHKELVSKNRWRWLTFRKPLTSLPIEK